MGGTVLRRRQEGRPAPPIRGTSGGCLARQLPSYEAFCYPDGPHLLDSPITDVVGVAAGIDSTFNASLPLPAATHGGVLPTGAGYHHYPKPIVDIDHLPPRRLPAIRHTRRC